MKCKCDGEDCDCLTYRFLGIKEAFKSDSIAVNFVALKRANNFQRLLIRMGDYYKAFFQDADDLAFQTGLTAVHRQRGVRICGFKLTDLWQHKKAVEKYKWKIIEELTPA